MLNQLKKQIKLISKYFSTVSFVFLLVMPASTNYQLDNYGFGSGGVGNATSSNYALDGITGEVSGGKLSSATYSAEPGLIYTNQANVPVAPTFTNPASYYNKLQLTINTSGNPSDTVFAIAISSDNFVTTQYVKSDHTVGATLLLADYQTYAAWGSGGGFFVVGLAANTTYYVKAKAMQGKFTETEFGPTATAATVSPTLSFAIRTDSTSTGPFAIGFGVMATGSVNTATDKIWADISTNGESGARVYVSGANAGLISSGASYTINSVTGDLAGLGEGFGAQGVSVTQSSGGPLVLTSPYNNLSGNNVGIVDTNIREIFNSAGPVNGGSGSFQMKSKPATTARPASDYSELLTVIAAGSF